MMIKNRDSLKACKIVSTLRIFFRFQNLKIIAIGLSTSPIFKCNWIIETNVGNNKWQGMS